MILGHGFPGSQSHEAFVSRQKTDRGKTPGNASGNSLSRHGHSSWLIQVEGRGTQLHKRHRANAPVALGPTGFGLFFRKFAPMLAV